MSLGGGYQESSQKSNSFSGLRGTPYFDTVAPGIANNAKLAGRLAGQFATSPFGYFQGKSVNDLIPTDKTGLPVEVGQALQGMGQDMFSKASAGGALRGQVDQQNTPGVVGSALQNIGQFLTPYIMDFKKYMTSLPDQLMNSRLGFLQNTIGATSPLVGSQSQYTGNSFGFNAYGSGSGGGGGMSPNCWIAGVLYGEGSVEQLAIRTWLGKQVSPFWNAINRLYTKYGQRVAHYISTRPWAQAIFRVPFNWMLKQAR